MINTVAQCAVTAHLFMHLGIHSHSILGASSTSNSLGTEKESLYSPGVYGTKENDNDRIMTHMERCTVAREPQKKGSDHVKQKQVTK